MVLLISSSDNGSSSSCRSPSTGGTSGHANAQLGDKAVKSSSKLSREELVPLVVDSWIPLETRLSFERSHIIVSTNLSTLKELIADRRPSWRCALLKLLRTLLQKWPYYFVVTLHCPHTGHFASLPFEYGYRCNLILSADSYCTVSDGCTGIWSARCHHEFLVCEYLRLPSTALPARVRLNWCRGGGIKYNLCHRSIQEVKF